MFGRDTDREWERSGSRDPYWWGGLNQAKFRDDAIDKDSVEEFFATGQAHIEDVLATIRERIVPGFAPSRALDFGCGVGRIAIPLARLCPAVVGVDVAEATLEEARRASARQGVQNISFCKSDDDLSQVEGEFDLVHTCFTLQHIPRERGERLIRRFVERLTDGGVGAIDLLIQRDVSAPLRVLSSLRKRIRLVHNLANLAEGKRFSTPLAQKNVYDLNWVVTLLHDAGCGNLHVKVFRNGRHHDAMLYFQKRRDRPVPHEALYTGPS